MSEYEKIDAIGWGEREGSLGRVGGYPTKAIDLT